MILYFSIYQYSLHRKEHRRWTWIVYTLTWATCTPHVFPRIYTAKGYRPSQSSEKLEEIGRVCMRMACQWKPIRSFRVTSPSLMTCCAVESMQQGTGLFIPGMKDSIFDQLQLQNSVIIGHWSLANVNVVTTCTEYDLKIFHTTMPFDGLCEYVCMVKSCITKKHVQDVFFHNTIKERELARAGGGGSQSKNEQVSDERSIKSSCKCIVCLSMITEENERPMGPQKNQETNQK